MIKNFFKRLVGLDQVDKMLAETEARLNDAVDKTALAQREQVVAEKAAEEAKLSSKELANKKGEAWVGVLDTKVNPENPRNGFFELDWNEKFIVQLKEAGYGFDGDTEEEIVDRWFRDLARNMLSEDGLDPNRPAGFIDVKRITENKSEVS